MGDGRAATATTTQLLESLRDPANEAVWADLEQRYRPILRAIATRLGLPAEDAADMAQQTLLDVVSGYREGRYERDKGRLRTWIITIAHRRAVDVLRERYRHADQRAQRRGESALDSLPEVDAVAAVWNEEEERSIVQEALRLLLTSNRIADTSKRVFELVQLRGVPEAAAAEQCGVSTDQVYLIKHRMLNRLRELTAELQEAYNDREAS
jgi:RNA polymerase sigma-70 factor, ECF subfamily